MTDKKQVLLKKLEQISLVLQENYQSKDEIGVLAGTSGIAVFQFYYSKLIQEETNADIGAEILSFVIEKINNGYSFHTFCSGIAGAAWAIALLQEEEFIDVDCDELLSGFDDFLIKTIKDIETDQNFFDFLHGILGIGFYFLKRYQNTKSKTLKDQYRATLLNIVALLQKTSQNDGNQTKWESYLIRDEGVKGYNLSLAHGITSIINFLSRLAAYEDFKSDVEDLLQQSIKYVLSFKIKDTQCTWSFPSWITNTNEKSDSSRLAWCYGDLGIGITLWRAGKILDNATYKTEAIQVLTHAAKRRDPEEAGVKDAGLCHGAYGIMHIYNYMYKETGEPMFKETMDFWLDQALKMAVHDDTYAGYMQWQGGENAGWRSEISLLEGVAGIGLSIISYLASFDTKWDECLLMN